MKESSQRGGGVSLCLSSQSILDPSAFVVQTTFGHGQVDASGESRQEEYTSAIQCHCSCPVRDPNRRLWPPNRLMKRRSVEG